MQQPLDIIICEDMEEDRTALLKMIQSCNIPTNCTIFTNGEDLVKSFVPQMCDLILSDIYMSGMTGIDAISEIRKIDKTVPVAFVTSSLDFALESYRLSALKYIEKPFKKESVEEILRLALLEKSSIPSLNIQKNGKERKIPFRDILYFEQHSHKLLVHFENGNVEEFYEKLSNILSQLSNQPFFNCHKSFCVNLTFVRYIDSDVKCFVMQDNSNVPIRRESFVQAKNTLAEYLFNSTRQL